MKINMDSEIIIIILKTWITKDIDSLSLLKQIWKRLETYQVVKADHTFREANLCIDALAKYGATSEESMIFSDNYPELIRRQLVNSDIKGISL